MKIVNDTTPQDNKVVAAEQRQVKTETLIDRIKPHPGHRCWQFDLSTGEITEAPVLEVNATMNGGTAKKILQMPGFMYCSALNKKNAIKRFIPMYGRLKASGQIVTVEQPAPDVATKIWNHTREDGEQVFIDWEVGDVIDKHDSGCADVMLTGEDEQGRKYTADGFTMSGELEEVSNVEEV